MYFETIMSNKIHLEKEIYRLVSAPESVSFQKHYQRCNNGPVGESFSAAFCDVDVKFVKLLCRSM